MGQVRVYVLRTTGDLNHEWLSEPVGDVAYASASEARAAWNRAYHISELCVGSEGEV
jgi:hypothetical protein